MRLKALTIDSVDDIDSVIAGIKELALPELWLRVVFDPENEAAYYNHALALLKQQPGVKIMGQILDSSAFTAISLGRFRRRVKSYLNQLYPHIDMLECGNEVNGNWLGSPVTVRNKVEFALEEARARRIPSAVTFYIPKDTRQLFRWLNKYPFRGEQPEYVFLSWYPYSEGFPDWRMLFGLVRGRYPDAKIGIGEYGVEGIALPNAKILPVKVALVRTVESLPAQFEDTIGFGGYWDGMPDVFTSRKLLPVFKEVWK